MNIKKPDNQLIIEMLRRKQGNLTDVARAFNVSRRAVEKWLKGNKTLQEVREDAIEELLDFTESQAFLLARGIPKIVKNPQTGKEELVDWIEKPDAGMIKFILSTKGKGRGYVTESKIEHSGEIKTNLVPFVLQVLTKDDDEGSDTQ
jgi:transcriptional regulator with XRE-family HTH domain